jgi:hypothetical protein
MSARFDYARRVERYAIADGVLRFVSHRVNFTPKSDAPTTDRGSGKAPLMVKTENP